MLEHVVVVDLNSRGAGYSSRVEDAIRLAVSLGGDSDTRYVRHSGTNSRA
jgi:hypothetical protein